MVVHVEDGQSNKSTAENAAGLDNQKQNQQHTQRESVQTRQTFQQSMRQDDDRRVGAMQVNNKIQRAFSRQPSGKSVKGFMAAFKKVLEEDLGENQAVYKMLILDGDLRRTPFSSIIFTTHGTDSQGEVFVTAHTLLIESSGGKLKSPGTKIGNQTIDLVVTPGDTATDRLWEIVSDIVIESYGKKVNVVEAGFNVLPREVREDDLQVLHGVAFAATAALQTVLDNQIGGRDEVFSIGWIKKSDMLSAHVDYNPLPITTAGGMPVRSDVTVMMECSERSMNENIDEQYGSKAISRVDGFVDLVYSPPGPVAYGGIPDTRHFFPRFVITNSTPLTNAVTMELQLLSLITSSLLTKNLAWAGVFKPRAGSDINLKNIGALGLELPELVGAKDGRGAMIDTQASTFDMQALYDLVRQTIHSEVVFTLHVEEAGDMSWLQQTFLAAANGNRNAIRVIIEAADNLTGGRFMNRFDANAIPIAEIDNNRVQLGYYRDGNNQLRDIRDIDYLALLNWLGDKDMAVVHEWANSFDQTDVPLELRLERRQKILQNILGEDGVRFTGYAVPVTFRPEFIQALTSAAEEAGLSIIPDRMSMDFVGSAVRGNSNIARYAVGQVGGNMFSSRNPYANYQSSGPNMGFWGRGGR